MSNNIFLSCESSLCDFHLTLREVKHYLRITNDDEDDFISSLIVNAYDAAEQFLCMSLSTKTWKLSIENINKDKILLPMGPVSSIIEVSTFDSNGNSSTIPSSNYYINASKDTAVFKQFYLSCKMEIRYISGYTQISEYFPANIKQGILYHIAAMFDIRSNSEALPTNSINLYKSFRKYNF